MRVNVSFWDAVLLSSWLLPVFNNIMPRGAATTSGQGVFVELNGVRLLNNSLVDIDDVPDENTVLTAGDNALNCVTNLVACCNSVQQNLQTHVGDWYYPNGSAVVNDHGGTTFRRNRGQSVIRMWRRGNPSQKGHFSCELPDNQLVNQTNYVNILDIGEVSVSPAGTTARTVGENFNLQCSVDITPNPLPENVPTPSFEWFFGSNNASLPSGVTVSPMTSSSDTYTSTLQFSLLQESHGGMYTCRLGGNPRLANNNTIIVSAPNISVQITTSYNDEVSLLPDRSMDVWLNCSESLTVIFNLTITYLWTKNNGTQTKVGMMRTLLFSPLKLSDAGQYTCFVTASAPYLSNNLTTTVSHYITLQIPAHTSVLLLSNVSNPIRPLGSAVTLNCTVMLNSGPEIDIPLTVEVELSKSAPVRSSLTSTTLSLSGSTYSTTTATVSSFGREQSGVYICRASVTVRQPNSDYITNNGPLSDNITLSTGVYLSLKGKLYQNNSIIPITDIGQTLEKEAEGEALLCYTDNVECCSNTSISGKWFLPDQSEVGIISEAGGFYMDDSQSVLRLHRRSQTISPTGVFCCEILDTTYAIQRLCAHLFHHFTKIAPIITTVNFNLLSEVSFSLTCISTGGPVDSMIWTRDGFLLDNTGPLILTNVTTVSYTNVLLVNNRAMGMYTCQTRGSGGQHLSSTLFTVSAAVTPLNVQASQSNPSVPVEVSWSPPSGGAATITGYGIRFDNRESIFVSSYVTRIVFNFTNITDELGKSVSIRTESTLLPSELISVTVIRKALSCSTELGTVIGMVILTVGLIIVMITLILLFLLRRKKSSRQPDLSVSANITYGQVKLEHQSEELYYEDLNTIIRCDQGGLKAVTVDNHATDESLASSCPPTMPVTESISREKSYHSQVEGQ